MNKLVPKIPGVKMMDCVQYFDARGRMIELWREDEVVYTPPAMVYFSVTKPGQQRGPHSHEFQTDCFAFTGPGDFEIHLWDGRSEVPLETHEVFIVGSSRPVRLIIPPKVIHGYKNISAYEGVVLNLPDRLYKGVDKQEPVDEVRWENNQESPYKME